MALSTLVRKLFERRPQYEPYEYWNQRSNPNNDEGLSDEQRNFDIQYIKQAVRGQDRILELGPGTGRTLSAYGSEQIVFTLDISKKYSDTLAAEANKRSIEVRQSHLESTESSFPFEDRYFQCGVASQVLLHIPTNIIQHTLNELQRTCTKLVIVNLNLHSTLQEELAPHVFNHDILAMLSDSGFEANQVKKFRNKIYLTASAVE